ncbi:winged helix-turn-helix transcriptional regulator [Archaeoglobus veneficus]|uniref:Transcriptional regulator, ArsR family n=1 Tax=Archaeoglobus veneficus (strain DSM 11195 / SNP6) TaxID=693661 RepID=F2KN89_ARCVS|nr:winged helix-turn-helix transcriptional regulator [Archaeoglobus veneficus]AEA46190.1 transcriptional regulator, ArsR family [Archaeoglobus veneficus SNP6]
MEIDLETRRRIYELIRTSPGIHFREIERRLKIAVGNLQYHLHYLEKKNLVRSEQDGEYIRYFPKDCRLDEADRKILSFLRRRTSRRILIHLLSNPGANNKDISRSVNLSPSTVSWHLNKLVEVGIVERKKEGRESYFKVKDPERVVRLIITYKESFLDRLVEGFVEAWERAEMG